MQDKITLQNLSKELVVLREIHELNKRDIKATFTDLVISLNDKGLASRGTVSKALDILFDQSQIWAEWGRNSNNNWCRILHIHSWAIDLAEKLMEFE